MAEFFLETLLASSLPQLSVERAISDGLGQMLLGNRLAAGEVGDRELSRRARMGR
jgi:hypothetical protein